MINYHLLILITIYFLVALFLVALWINYIYGYSDTTNMVKKTLLIYVNTSDDLKPTNDIVCYNPKFMFMEMGPIR